jgi:hypothetical protein
MKLLIHVEQYDVLGILPSQLESLALHNTARGVTDAVYIDKTRDGFRGVSGFRKVDSLKDFLASEQGPFFAFSPTKGEDIRTVKVPSDAWLLFGPSMGLATDAFNNINVTWVKVPGGELNSRDIVPIALWQLWQEQ